MALNRTLWDGSKGRSKGKSEIDFELNEMLEGVQFDLKRHRREILGEGKDVTANLIKNRYLGIDENRRGIIEVFEQHNKECKLLIGKDYALGTYKRFKTCLNHVENFLTHQYKLKEVFFKGNQSSIH